MSHFNHRQDCRAGNLTFRSFYNTYLNILHKPAANHEDCQSLYILFGCTLILEVHIMILYIDLLWDFMNCYKLWYYKLENII